MGTTLLKHLSKKILLVIYLVSAGLLELAFGAGVLRKVPFLAFGNYLSSFVLVFILSNKRKSLMTLQIQGILGV